ncbi:MAG: orotate phosphoribosyltransferase [Alphaproteobacteria bacterium]|nr:orotate phosphoribosyltransferase [Alphaproteobacteria bacterium]
MTAAEKRERLRQIIREKSFSAGGDFRLASGTGSSIYFDLKKTVFDPEGATLVADMLFEAIRHDDVDQVGGLEIGAVPIATAVAMRSWPERPIRAFFVRKEAKGHGTNKLIDGEYRDGGKTILVEDVTTTGGSAMKAVNAVRERGGAVIKIVTIVDRLEGAKAKLAREGIELVALFTRDDFAA